MRINVVGPLAGSRFGRKSDDSGWVEIICALSGRVPGNTSSRHPGTNLHQLLWNDRGVGAALGVLGGADSTTHSGSTGFGKLSKHLPKPYLLLQNE
jgi:hypothetical protein